MTDFQDAKAELESSIAGNREFLKVQDVGATLNATLSAVAAIRKATIEWARAETSLKVIGANTDAELLAVMQDPKIVELRQLAALLAGSVAEVRSQIEQIALKARTLA